MVKNKFGGNRHKKWSDAKLVQSRKTRFIKEEGEIYAKVTKMSGGGHAVIECSDGVERTLVIRNKFKNVIKEIIVYLKVNMYWLELGHGKQLLLKTKIFCVFIMIVI